MNYNKLLVLIAVMLWQLPTTWAQTDYRLTLDRTGADQGTETIQLANGNLLIAGNTQNGATASSGQDGFLMEINPTTRAIIWSQAYDVTSSDEISAVIQASNGDLIAGGSVVGGTTRDKWFLRVDANGNLLNSSTFGRDDQTTITQIVESVTTSNGAPTYVITGPTSNFNDVYAARVREDGSLVWLNEYTGVASWTYSAVEASDGTIYLGGNASAETSLYLLTLNTDGSIFRSDRYDNLVNVVGGIRRMFLADDNTIAVVGGSREVSRTNPDARPFFMLIQPSTRTVPVSRYYNTVDATYNSIVDISPTHQNGVHNGYLLLLRQEATVGETQMIQVNLTGEILRYTTFASTNQASKIHALADEMTAVHLSYNNNRVDVNRFPIDILSGCMDSGTLTHSDVPTTVNGLNAAVNAISTTLTASTTTTNAINWSDEVQCCQGQTLASCCPDTLLITSNDTTICLGETVNLTAGVMTNSTSILYNWSTGATTTAISVTPTITTTYTIVVEDTLTNCIDSAQITVTVLTGLQNASLTAVTDTCTNTPFHLTASPSNATNYAWSANAGYTFGVVGASSNYYLETAVANFGNNVYSVEITSAEGCTVEVSTTVEGVSCCQVTANSNDYVQLDPDNTDPRLADYGIVRYSNSRSYIMSNAAYNRMPARMRFAENVVLYVRTANNSPTPTVMDITNSDLVFNRNSGIIVETASKIIGHNAVLRPCDDNETWNGVRVEGRTTRPASVVDPYFESQHFFHRMYVYQCPLRPSLI